MSSKSPTIVAAAVLLALSSGSALASPERAAQGAFDRATAVSEAKLADVRGLGQDRSLTVENADVLGGPTSGSNRLVDSFGAFSGIGHVIQNNGNNAAIAVETHVDIQHVE
jgi:hypothetical protein